MTPDPRPRESSVLELANTLLRHQRLMIGLPLAMLVLAVTATLLRSRTYTATASFLPQSSPSSGTAGALSGVAAQFGISLPSSGGPPPQFYAGLMESPTILRPLSDSLTVTTTSGRRLTLAQLFDVQGTTPAIRQEQVTRKLMAAVTAGVDLKTSAVTYTVQTTDANVSGQIASAAMDRIAAFAADSRRAKAAAEQAFMEDQLGAAARALQQAESAQELFLVKNRLYQNDPELNLEYQRLNRIVRIRDQIYTSLAQLLAQASIESARNTPSLLIIEAPMAPVFADTRPWPLIAVLALLVGFMLAAFVAFARRFIDQLRSEEPRAFDEFTTLRQRLAADIARPLKVIARRTPKTPPVA
jgi:uncharacterized protein involved in exopolysaccharide biosynthesis